jgi:hypothetical protein
MHILSPRGSSPARTGFAARLAHNAIAVAALIVVAGFLAACGGSGQQGPASGGAGADAASGAGAPGASGATAVSPTTMVVVPQLVGRRQDEAHRILDRAGLQMRWTGFVGKYGNGRYNIGCVKVLRQSPVAGEKRPHGAQIAVIEAACQTPNQRPHGVTTGGQPEA